jgi:ligand-binding sensor domain-containing protein
MCGYGVFIADPETLSLKRMTGLPADDYSDIAETVNGSIWAAGAHSVVHIDGKTGNTSVYHPDPENRFGSSSFTIYTDEQERVWIGSNGLFLFDPDKKSFTGFMTSNHVRHIVGYSDGKLLVGHGHGLFLFDPDTGKHDTISEGWSTSVLKDKQGIIWHSSLKGLNKIKPQLKNFRVQKTFGNIFSIEKDGNQDIWMGTTKGEFRFNSSFSEILAFARPSASGPLSFMGADNEGSVYFTRSPNKFKKYDFRSKIISVEQTMPVADEFVISLFVDSFGHAWLGGWQGVRRYDPKTRSVDTLPALIAATVYCFLENSYKNLWIGTGSGLIRYNLVTGDFILIRNDPADNKSLSDNTVFHMTMDEAKNIWIGTDRGLNKLVIGTENGKPEFIRWTAGTSGLPDDNVFCIVEDEDRTVWLACGNNISHFDPEKNNFRNYGPDAYRTDGLAGTPFRNAQYLGGKAVRTSDGKIIFAIYGGGLVIFHPDSLVDNSHVPPVVITDFLIGNQRVPVAKSEADTLDWETPLPKAIPYTGAMKLPYHQNDFSFEFAALNFINPKNNPI